MDSPPNGGLDPATAKLFQDHLLRLEWSREYLKQSLPLINQARLPTFIQTDLLTLGGFPNVRLLDNVQMTLDISRELRDVAVQFGRPARIEIVELIASPAGGNFNFLGYTCPPGREARIDYVTLICQDPGLGTTLGFECRCTIELTPAGSFTSSIADDQLQMRTTTGATRRNLIFPGNIHIVANDNVAGEVIQVVGLPGVGLFQGLLSIFGIEVDAGYGFAGFP